MSCSLACMACVSQLVGLLGVAAGGYTIAPPAAEAASTTPQPATAAAAAPTSSAAAAGDGDSTDEPMMMEDEGDEEAWLCNESDTDDEMSEDGNGDAAADGRNLHGRPHQAAAFVAERPKHNSHRHPPLDRFTALFIQRCGYSSSSSTGHREPEGLVTAPDGRKFVRAWPTLTLLPAEPSTGRHGGNKHSKGRNRQTQQAVKFSTDPTSWSAKHGYRKFCRVSVLSGKRGCRRYRAGCWPLVSLAISTMPDSCPAARLSCSFQQA